MDRQNGFVNLPVENDVSLQVANRLGIRADSRGIVQRVQIRVEIEAGLQVQRANLVAAN